MSWISPLAKLATLRPGEESEALRQKLHQGWVDFYPTKGKPAMQAWEASLGTDVVQVTVQVPRRADILHAWDLVSPDDDDDDDTRRLIAQHVRTDGTIPVTLRMPLSVCSASDQALATEERNEFGCRTLDRVDLSQLNIADVPLVLYFHGGGLTSGSCDDSSPMDLVQRISEASSGKPLILASVGYSLAPTHVFPAAPAEALTVVDYFIQHLPSPLYNFHILGISAGGNLAAVTGLELMRRHPPKLASLAAWVPMLDPAANSMSFYMQRSILWVSPAWLRWCWRCYLGLPNDNDKDDDANINIFSLDNMADRLAHGSNQAAWAASPWRTTKLARLVNPTLDLPSNLHQVQAPISIVTNRADPLYDDGLTLFHALRDRGGNVEHVDHPGSHWFGTVLDPHNFQHVTNVWQKQVFGAV